MLERIQDRSLLHMMNINGAALLRGAGKALAQWAIIDDYDRILDLNCGDGRLVNYLSRKYCLRACGIAPCPEQAHNVQKLLPDAEVYSARKEDIPWRSDAFNAVFYQMNNSDENERGDFLQEVVRVLKPGGQVLIALHALPDFVSAMASAVGLTDGEGLKHKKLLAWMEDAGLKDVSWRLTGPMTGVAIGWKQRETERCMA